MNARVALPARRPARVEAIEWHGRDWILGFGFDRHGRIREVFVDGAKTGADIEGWADKSCMMVSKLLQLGDTVETLRAWLGAPTGVGVDQPDLIDAILATAIAIEAADGDAIREGQLCADGKHPLQQEKRP